MFLKIGDAFYTHVNMAIYEAKDKEKEKKNILHLKLLEKGFEKKLIHK